MKYKKLRVFFLVLAFVFVSKFSFAQIDTISSNVIQNVYKEVPNTVQNEDEKRTSFSAYPYVFYTPESKFAFGAGGIFIFYGGQGKELKPSKIGFGGYYSTNKQYNISMRPNLYFFDNKLYLEAPISYGYTIGKFWGVGNESPDYGNASYSMKSFKTTLTVQFPPELFSADRTGIIFDYDNTKIVDKMGNEFLETDSVAGSNGGDLFGFGTDLVWDSRDNIFFPNSGGYQYFKAVVYPGMSDYTFATIELDVRAYRAISPDHVFAFNFYVQSAMGDTPFYKLPALGGQSRMRGFFSGRYRDNFYGMLQAEYRQYIWKRLGMVAFGGLGNVSEDMLAFDFKNMKYGGGLGLRFLFNEKERVNLRMDIAFGNDGNRGIYFGIQEAF